MLIGADGGFSARGEASDLAPLGAAFLAAPVFAAPSPAFLAPPLAAFLSSASGIDQISRALGEPHLAPVIQNLESDPGRLAVLRVREGQIGQVDRRLLLDDAALLVHGLALVTLDEVDAAHEGAVFLRHHLEHFAGAALVAAGQDDDLVALLDLRRHHSTSGASEMIFMWFLARSSRGTGPKIRVPTGSF